MVKFSFQDVKNTHDLTDQQLFRYLQMTDYYIRDIKTNEDKIHPIIKLLVQTYSSAVLRAVSVLYGYLMTLE